MYIIFVGGGHLCLYSDGLLQTGGPGANPTQETIHEGDAGRGCAQEVGEANGGSACLCSWKEHHTQVPHVCRSNIIEYSEIHTS